MWLIAPQVARQTPACTLHGLPTQGCPRKSPQADEGLAVPHAPSGEEQSSTKGGVSTADQALWWHGGLTPVGGGGRAPQGRRTTDLHPGTGPRLRTAHTGEAGAPVREEAEALGVMGIKATGTKEQNDTESELVSRAGSAAAQRWEDAQRCTTPAPI